MDWYSKILVEVVEPISALECSNIKKICQTPFFFQNASITNWGFVFLPSGGVKYFKVYSGIL